MLRISN